MTALANEIDAEFFSLVHRLATSPDRHPNSERRDGRRKPFRSVQRMAVSTGETIPDDSAFVPIQCHDLTQRGFSFLFPARPDFRSIVVAFGAGRETIYAAAEVSHCAEVLVHPSGAVAPAARQADGDPALHEDRPKRGRMFLVGCRFVKRLRPEPAGV